MSVPNRRAREIQARRFNNNDTETIDCNGARKADNAMPYHRTKVVGWTGRAVQ